MSKQRLWVRVHRDLDFGDMTLSQGNDKPLAKGQEMWEILSRSNSKELWPEHGLWQHVHCDLDL